MRQQTGSQQNFPPSLNGLSIYPLDKLLGMWKSGAMTVEQLAGQLLQYAMLIEQRLKVFEKNSPTGSGRGRTIETDHRVD